MRRRIFPHLIFAIGLFILISVFGTGCETSGKPKLAQTPPMGWNSFDSYGVYLHEKAALENIESMAEKLKPHGYEYFVIDNGWFGEYKLQAGTIFAAEKHASDININEYGYFLPSKVYFPNGFKTLINRCHELGLKFGLHLMRGIPRKAFEMNVTIEGTKYSAREIANTNPAYNCTWCTYNYGVDMQKPGAQQWYDGLVQHIADMGVDYIKYDDIVPYPDEVEAVAKAIEKCGRPIVLSLSPGGSVNPNAIESFRKANLLRVTHDIWDEQTGIDECFKVWHKWSGKERPGFWIDMDMIPFGQLQLMSPPGEQSDPMAKGDIALAGKGTRRWSQFSKEQQRTFITMRALAASPLMIGGDLPTLDDYSLKIITHPEMIACNQNGKMGKMVYQQGHIETWSTQEKGNPDNGWLAIFNRDDDALDIKLNQQILGLPKTNLYELKDIWQEIKLDFSNWQTKTISIAAFDVIFIRYQSY